MEKLKEQMRLDEAPLDVPLEVKAIVGGWGIRLNLSRLGIYINDPIKVVQKAPLGGPLLIEHLKAGTKIALGRGITRKIIVERLDEE